MNKQCLSTLDQACEVTSRVYDRK